MLLWCPHKNKCNQSNTQTIANSNKGTWCATKMYITRAEQQYQCMEGSGLSSVLKRSSCFSSCINGEIGSQMEASTINHITTILHHLTQMHVNYQRLALTDLTWIGFQLDRHDCQYPDEDKHLCLTLTGTLGTCPVHEESDLSSHKLGPHPAPSLHNMLFPQICDQKSADEFLVVFPLSYIL